MQTNAFTIEKNVPLLKPRVERGKYPFPDMEVGDSFSLPVSERNRTSSAAVNHAQKHGGKFAIRKIYAETCRCWRVA